MKGYGYGCGIENIFNLGFGHSGAHAGYLSRMATDPQTDFTVVAFTNAWDYSNGLTSMKEQLYNLVDEACYRRTVRFLRVVPIKAWFLLRSRRNPLGIYLRDVS